MKVKLYIIATMEPNSNPWKCVDSCSAFIDDATSIVYPGELNKFDSKNEDWFLVLYDNEQLDPELAEAMPVFLAHDYYDALIMAKNDNNKITKCPRMFKSHLTFPDQGLLPNERDIKFEKALNGFIIPC